MTDKFRMKTPVRAVQVVRDDSGEVGIADADRHVLKGTDTPSWFKYAIIDERIVANDHLTAFSVRTAECARNHRTQAEQGDWIVYDNAGNLHIYTDTAFHKCFKVDE